MESRKCFLISPRKCQLPRLLAASTKGDQAWLLKPQTRCVGEADVPLGVTPDSIKKALDLRKQFRLF